ncbi:hypothetical protein [Bradyrhizobium sp. CCBAU 65884]|uniref:hypothetical protein n=1 Tax=Bradyrhizobium sp. CCBAU 65884 TaxID=722477 RepID=UPI002305E951|nr:hypothetical protein [Bradyrhizobium sp. CCBAU 65884]
MTTIVASPLQDNRLVPGKPERDPKMAEFARQAHGLESASGNLCHRSSGQVCSEYFDRMLNEHHSHKWFRHIFKQPACQCRLSVL